MEVFARNHGAAAERVLVATGIKAALRISVGPGDKPGYVLPGHCDVVSVEGKPWSS